MIIKKSIHIIKNHIYQIDKNQNTIKKESAFFLRQKPINHSNFAKILNKEV